MQFKIDSLLGSSSLLVGTFIKQSFIVLKKIESVKLDNGVFHTVIVNGREILKTKTSAVSHNIHNGI